MSQNDLIALEANYNNWLKERAVGLSADIKPFSYFCIDQFLKHYEFLDDDIIYGYTDESHDGGVDAIYFIVNKLLVREDTRLDPRGEVKINLVIFQIKETTGGFAPNEINKLYFFTDNLLDISREARNFKQEYHQQLIDLMSNFKEKYQIISGERPPLKIDYYYITKGDEQKPNISAQDAIDRIKGIVKKHFNKAEYEFHCVNAQGLLDQIETRPKRSKPLSWSVNPMPTAEESYVGLVNLQKYYEFLTDENGDIDERMFDENVRGYQGDVTVNEEIWKTLNSDKNINFWLLNNGITIITPDASTAGFNQVQLVDPQIVNGLQTSRLIFKYFSEVKPTDEKRSILVKVIEIADETVQDKIIKATNNQTALPQGALRATDPVHSRIEVYFKDNDLYYERRKKFYKDKRIPIAKTVSMTELAQAMISVLLQNADDARRRPSDYLADNSKYKEVFGEAKYPLPIYLISLKLMRKVAVFISSIKELERNEKLDIKFHMTSLLACFLTKEVTPSVEKLMQIKINEVDSIILSDCYKRVRKIYDNLKKTDTVRSPKLMQRLKTHIKRSLANRRA
jgi:hypothetical protein